MPPDVSRCDITISSTATLAPNRTPAVRWKRFLNRRCLGASCRCSMTEMVVDTSDCVSDLRPYAEMSDGRGNAHENRGCTPIHAESHFGSPLFRKPLQSPAPR